MMNGFAKIDFIRADPESATSGNESSVLTPLSLCFPLLRLRILND